MFLEMWNKEKESPGGLSRTKIHFPLRVLQVWTIILVDG